MLAFLKMNVFTLLLAIPEQLQPQNSDCIHCNDNLSKIDLPSKKKKKFLTVSEAGISLDEGVGILIFKVE